MSGSSADLTAASPDEQIGVMKVEEGKEKVEPMEEKPWNNSPYYRNPDCECCRRLAVTAFEAMSDDEDYDSFEMEDDDDEAEQQLRLRIIHYTRSVYKSGGFYVECPPNGSMGGIFNMAHFPYSFIDRAANKSLTHAIDTYNTKSGKKLVHQRTLNVTASRANWFVFYFTFEGLDPDDDDGVPRIYETIVSYSSMDHLPREVLVFRRQAGEDLLEPDPHYGRVTRRYND
ncbi:hypothetical protein LINGRAHAP2_LOCUS12172 [Linum grandiflorum]